MSLSSFSTLLEAWQNHAQQEQQKLTKPVSYYASDELKLRALATVYSLPIEDIMADLLHHALFELEEKMPYVPGSKVIRVEEGSKIYDDVGPMSRYLETLKTLESSS